MNEAEFLERYQKDIPILSAWGDCVNSVLINALSEKLKNSPIKDVFLRIYPVPRIKEKKSIIAKAFWRGKNYTDPYEEITDKIGVRYVVLLVEHIEIISSVIQEYKQWDYSLDRDFEEEKAKFPFLFDYQSVHYILRNKTPVKYDNTLIPANTPCEVQIRTLLQHACCELTHDTIYKKEPARNPKVYRSIAKSRALTESADDIFTNVAGILAAESKAMRKLLNQLIALYEEIHQPEFDEKSNVFILDSIVELIGETDISDIRKFFEENTILKDIISDKAERSFIYRQPIILLLYYLVQNKRESLKNAWPLPSSEIQPLFSDLGFALDPNI